jgi:hypothetical protein
METTVKLNYNNDGINSMAFYPLINFIETLTPELLKFGVKMELLGRDGIGYEEVKITSLIEDEDLELLLKDNDFEEKCYVISQTVESKISSLEDALEYYNISAEDFKKYRTNSPY